MSGTSLDGVDLAHCVIEENGSVYQYDLNCCLTIPYPAQWLQRLNSLPQASALEYAKTHTDYGRYIGQLVNDFIIRNNLAVDFVASHGHTIFHNPQQHYTAQIGDGASIASISRLPVVCDFRTGDVAAGGQGAPLVPMGDELLFATYNYCLNLGGFANISIKKQGSRIAFDVVPVNIVLNHLANKRGVAFDFNGDLASTGIMNSSLLEYLNHLDYYHAISPKSLGREWVEKEIFPLFSFNQMEIEDIASTFCEHIAIQIAACLENNPEHQMLVTGGGAFNAYLISRIEAATQVRLIIPDPKTVNFKEALVFAFLGLLRMQHKPNCLTSVTGASHHVTGGAVYLP